MSIKRYAGSRGQTPREFLKYAFKRLHQKEIEPVELTLDLIKIDRDENYIPLYVDVWMRRRKMNGYAAIKPVGEANAHSNAQR